MNAFPRGRFISAISVQGFVQRLTRIVGAIEVRLQCERPLERRPPLGVVSLFHLCKTEMVLVHGIIGRFVRRALERTNCVLHESFAVVDPAERIFCLGALELCLRHCR